MAVRVVKQVEDKKVYKHTCICCGAQLEYNEDDVKTYFWWESYNIKAFTDYINCPACQNNTTVRRYYKDYL